MRDNMGVSRQSEHPMDRDRERSYYDARREFLARFHLPLQRVLTWIIGPISTSIYLVPLFGNPAWQEVVLFFGMIAMWGAWYDGLRFCARGDRLYRRPHPAPSAVHQ